MQFNLFPVIMANTNKETRWLNLYSLDLSISNTTKRLIKQVVYGSNLKVK